MCVESSNCVSLSSDMVWENDLKVWEKFWNLEVKIPMQVLFKTQKWCPFIVVMVRTLLLSFAGKQCTVRMPLTLR